MKHWLAFFHSYVYIYIYIYIYMCVCVYMYLYLYTTNTPLWNTICWFTCKITGYCSCPEYTEVSCTSQVPKICFLQYCLYSFSLVTEWQYEVYLFLNFLPLRRFENSLCFYTRTSATAYPKYWLNHYSALYWDIFYFSKCSGFYTVFILYVTCNF
jgi:hypothetical protein